MKQKLSITIDEDIVKEIEDKINGRLFRNKSHIIEYALYRLLRGRECSEEIS
jgi:Arc/MetJ-type ribon-helix-helix transcriptional regulator